LVHSIHRESPDSLPRAGWERLPTVNVVGGGVQVAALLCRDSSSTRSSRSDTSRDGDSDYGHLE
jgi:hypothetical protein